MSSSADRQRRLRERRRRHATGDHDLCIEGRCEAKPAPDIETSGDGEAGVTRDVTDTPKNSPSHRPLPADLGARGRRLWDEMSTLKLGPAHVLLLERACRKADRLERMDAQLRGRDWLDVVEVPNADGAVVQLVVDKLLSEVRQTEVALKLDVAELRHAGRAATAGGGVVPPSPPAEDEGGGTGAKRGGLAAIRGGLETTG
jgi:hypothetical protein